MGAAVAYVWSVLSLPAPLTEFIAVGADSTGFVRLPSGEPFAPWGFNYDHDSSSRLIEDYWTDEWDTVADDFAEMRALGANVVRVHLQFARFMNDPATPHEAALAQLERLLRLAEQTGLYLDLTGLACYRRADVPAWYNDADEAGRWAAQERFWSAVASRCADSPAVFCYDLMNEPVVPGAPRQRGDWLTGEFGGFTFVQFLTLDPAGRATPDIARDWIRRMAAAIRQHDARHLITVGLLPIAANVGFPPGAVAPELDFISTHLYPKSGELPATLATLRSFAVGKPVLVEETFPLSCSAGELAQFMRDAAADAAGWIGFYWGRTPDELRAEQGLRAALALSWLELFQRGRPRQGRAD